MTDKEKEQLQEAEQHRKNKLIHLTKTEKENLLKLEDGFNQYVLNYQNPTDLTGYATETWVSQQNYLTSYTETDPVFSLSPSAGITAQNILDWDAKLSSFTETDPIFTTHLSTYPNKYLDWTNASSNLLTTGTITAEQLTSTDDITMAGIFTNVLGSSDVCGVYIDGATNDYNGFDMDTNALYVRRDIAANVSPVLTSVGIRSLLTFDGTAGDMASINNRSAMFQATSAATYSTASGIAEINAGTHNIVIRGGTVTASSFMGSPSNITNYGAWYYVYDTTSYNKAANGLNVKNIGAYFLIQQAGTQTAGTLTKINYGSYTDITGAVTGGQVSTNYGHYLYRISGATTNWGFYNDTTAAHNFLGKDNVLTYFGTGLDTTISYTGTIWEFDVKKATTSIRFNAITKLDTDFEVWGDTGVLLHLDAASLTSYIRPNVNQTTSFQFQDIAGTGSALTVDTTNLRVGINKATAPSYPLDVVGEIYSSTTITNPKIKLTAEGGYAVKMTNRTGAVSVKGNVVHPSATYANAVELIIVDVPNPIGVFYESGIADGAEAWVVVSGIADVYYVGNTTLNHIARGFLTADGASYVAGQALSEAIPTSPFNVDKHFYEIGHITEARTGAGLAKTILHFN